MMGHPIRAQVQGASLPLIASNVIPSFFTLRLLSCSMRRLTNLDKTVRETTKETVDPSIVPEA